MILKTVKLPIFFPTGTGTGTGTGTSHLTARRLSEITANISFLQFKGATVQ